MNSKWQPSPTELWIAVAWTRNPFEWRIHNAVCVSVLVLANHESVWRSVVGALDNALPPDGGAERKGLSYTYAPVGIATLSGDVIQLHTSHVRPNMLKGHQRADTTMRSLQVRLALREGGWLLDPRMEIDTPWLGVGTPATHHDPRATTEADRCALIIHNHGGIQRVHDWLLITPAKIYYRQ
jgi:hypothetical protein